MIHIFTILFIAISFFLFKRASGSMSVNKINMISFIYYFYLLAHSYIGSYLILMSNYEFNNVIIGINNNQTKFLVWIAISYSIVVIPIGMIICNFIFNKNDISKIFNHYINSNITSSISIRDSYIRTPLYLTTIICFYSVIYTFYNIGYLPQIAAIKVTDPISLLIMRNEISRDFPGLIYIKNLFGLTLTPIMTFVAYSYYQKTKTKFDYFWFLFLLINSILFLTHDLSKGPLAQFLLGFVFLKILINGGIKSRYLVYSFSALFLLLLTSYLLITKNFDVLYLFSYKNEGLVGRILISEISSLYRHFEIFPLDHEFIGFSSLSKFISSIVGLPFTERSARITMEIVNFSWIEKGYGGVLNTLFIGEAWANFGLYGILFTPLLVGFSIQSLYLFLLTRKKTPIYLGIFTYYSYKSSIVAGINDYIYNPFLIVVFITFFGLVFISWLLLNLKQTTLIK